MVGPDRSLISVRTFASQEEIEHLSLRAKPRLQTLLISVRVLNESLALSETSLMAP